MPRVSVWFVRAALLYLVGGITLGALILADKGVAFSLSLWRWLPVHIELLLTGWFVQLVMGVAYWIFPRFGMTPAARGREQLAWLALGLVNVGIGAVCVGVMAGRSGFVLGGRLAELAAAAALASNVWTRARASGISPM